MGALRKSLDMLILMVFFISLCIVFFATLMYYAERGTWQEALGRSRGRAFPCCAAVLHTLAPSPASDMATRNGASETLHGVSLRARPTFYPQGAFWRRPYGQLDGCCARYSEA